MQIQISAYFRGLKVGRIFEGSLLIRKGRFIDISIFRVGTYYRDHLFEGVTYLIVLCLGWAIIREAAYSRGYLIEILWYKNI